MSEMWSEKISGMFWSEKFGDELLRWLAAKDCSLKMVNQKY
jgi:hypothetical protein